MRICTLVWHYNIEFIKITSVLTFKFQGLDCHIIVFTEPFQNKQSNPCSIWFPTLFKIAQNLKKIVPCDKKVRNIAMIYPRIKKFLCALKVIL